MSEDRFRVFLKVSGECCVVFRVFLQLQSMHVLGQLENGTFLAFLLNIDVGRKKRSALYVELELFHTFNIIKIIKINGNQQWHIHSRMAIRPLCPDRIGIRKSWFLRRGENRRTRRKTSRSKDENQQQNSTHI